MGIKEENAKLFTEFPPVTTEEWEKKILSDLKGANYEKKLIWKTDEGFDVKPYYRSEDLNGLEYLTSPPGEYPYVRGNRKSDNNWSVRQDFSTQNVKEANLQALDAIEKGADAIGLCALQITTHNQIHRLLSGIDLTRTPIHFTSSRSYPLTLELFNYEVTERGHDGRAIHGSINFDPISFLLLHGDFYISKENNFEEAEYILNTLPKKLPDFKAITINGHYFHNAGSNIVQELGFTLASAHEYLFEMVSRGITVDTVAPRMLIFFAVGSNYFMEIAKLRAVRILWSKLVGQYHPRQPESYRIFIHSTTSSFNKTVFDPYVNMLRTTTEGMAAAIGNSDSISIQAFDSVSQEADEFSRRIARNQQLILKEESYLNKVVDPSAGSYYIENLTHSIACHAWDLFKQVEGKGGMISCIQKGFIQDEVAKSCKKKTEDIESNKTILIGTNKYPSQQEVIPENVVTWPVKNPDELRTKYPKLRLVRGAEECEKERMGTNNH